MVYMGRGVTYLVWGGSFTVILYGVYGVGVTYLVWGGSFTVILYGVYGRECNIPGVGR